MAQRASLSPELIIRTAVQFVDEHGIEALSLRKLGEELNAHATAVYRHFASRDDLLDAMFGFVISDVAAALNSANDDPEDRIRAIALAFRAALHEHPGLVGTIVSTRGTEATYGLQRQIAADMIDIGVPKSEVALKYQVLESYVFGASMFDYLGAPTHLASRLERFTQVRDGIFDTSATNLNEIDGHNEAAFVFGLNAILKSFTN